MNFFHDIFVSSIDILVVHISIIPLNYTWFNNKHPHPSTETLLVLMWETRTKLATPMVIMTMMMLMMVVMMMRPET